MTIGFILLHDKLQPKCVAFFVASLLANILVYTTTLSTTVYVSALDDKIKSPPILLDKNGIPMVDYQNSTGEYLGQQINPVTVTHVALDQYKDYKIQGNTTARQFFINNANWLVENAVSRGNFSVLEYNYQWDTYNLTPPWQSAMAQGGALDVLVKAHEITGDQKYLDTAKKLLNSFFYEVKDGGVTYKTIEDGWWYEEYAGPGGKQPKVLNGMMYALLGVYEYYQYTNDSDARYIFDQGITALKESLPNYEYEGNYSNYDILGTTNPLGYHIAHVRLLNMLYEITKEDIFKVYSDKWENFQSPSFLDGQTCRFS